MLYDPPFYQLLTFIFFNNYIEKDSDGFVGISSILKEHSNFIWYNIVFQKINFTMTKWTKQTKQKRLNHFIKLFNQHPIFDPKYSAFGWRGFSLYHVYNKLDQKIILPKPNYYYFAVYVVVSKHLNGENIKNVKKIFDKQLNKYTNTKISMPRFIKLCQRYMTIKNNKIYISH